jgi:hypothetical protein
MTDDATVDCSDQNPYVGARPFREGEAYYGREREARGLSDTLISSRIVLLHSPSGAGKTSLIQAAIAPLFAERKFQLCGRTEPSFSALRVNEPPPDFEVGNRYVYSAVLGLVGHLVSSPVDLGAMSLCAALAMLEDPARPYQLLVFDQLEEALTLDPPDRQGQQEFFRQVGEALDDEHRWGLLSMREDYMGGLDRFLRYIPGRLRSTYRLDFLDEEPALRAIQEPARQRGVEVDGDAARKLFDDLRTVLVEGPDHDPEPHKGPHVEPVLLQVVCHRLWRTTCKDSAGGQFSTIGVADLSRLGRVDDAIRRYYADIVEEAAANDVWTERAVRDWVGHQLITEERFRSQKSIGPPVSDPNGVLAILQDRYLIRSDERVGTTWWELCHDRLIDPVLEDNAEWRERRLEQWQLAALKWNAAQDGDFYLLPGEAAREAKRWLARNDQHATDIERRFVDRSMSRQAETSAMKWIAVRTQVLSALLAVSLLVNLVLALVLIGR